MSAYGNKSAKKKAAPKDEQLTLEAFWGPGKDAARIKALSGALRRNMTREERRLDARLFRAMGIPAQRQKVIGTHIVDFFVPPCYVIELDGSQHFSEKGLAADRARDEELTALGFTVLRYANSDVRRNFEGVCEDILAHLGL